MSAIILHDRAEKLGSISLLNGAHDPGEQMCVMEAVAWVAGEPWSDHPECSCPVITAFMVAWNDALPANEDRDRLLRPLIPLLVGTRSTKAVEATRSKMALDWFITEYTPAWLDLAGLKEEAATLRSAPTLENCELAREKASAALSAAESAALSAALSAAWSAALSAARSAAWSAARSAAWSAARSAAWSAAWSAAESAAWSAAESAATTALLPTVTALQASAVALVRRMIEVKEGGEA